MFHIHKFTFNPFQENTYVLVNDQKHAIIIDPGMYEIPEFDHFFKFLTDHEIKPVLLLNTHTHLDHLFGNAAVMMKYKVPLAFHHLDRPVFDAAKSAGALYNMEFVTSPPPTGYLQSDEEINLGTDTLRVLFTPGHSPGSVCFYCEAQQFVIGGDVLFQGSIGRTDLPGGNHEDLIESIRLQLLSLKDDVIVYAGHGPETTIGQERVSNPYLKGIMV